MGRGRHDGMGSRQGGRGGGRRGPPAPRVPQGQRAMGRGRQHKQQPQHNNHMPSHLPPMPGRQGGRAMGRGDFPMFGGRHPAPRMPPGRGMMPARGGMGNVGRGDMRGPPPPPNHRAQGPPGRGLPGLPPRGPPGRGQLPPPQQQQHPTMMPPRQQQLFLLQQQQQYPPPPPPPPPASSGRMPLLPPPPPPPHPSIQHQQQSSLMMQNLQYQQQQQPPLQLPIGNQQLRHQPPPPPPPPPQQQYPPVGTQGSLISEIGRGIPPPPPPPRQPNQQQQHHQLMHQQHHQIQQQQHQQPIQPQQQQYQQQQQQQQQHQHQQQQQQRPQFHKQQQAMYQAPASQAPFIGPGAGTAAGPPATQQAPWPGSSNNNTFAVSRSPNRSEQRNMGSIVPSSPTGPSVGPTPLQQPAQPVSLPLAKGQSQSVSHQPDQQQAQLTEQEIDQAWSEHVAPNGMNYYYNSISKESSYSKPEALKKKEAAIADSKKQPKKKWTEYLDANTGRKYYSDGATTRWEKPAELGGPTEPASDKGRDRDATEETASPTKKKKRMSVKKETVFSSKEEAVAAFKGLLFAKDVAPALKWNEVTKLCSLDHRWEACEDVLTTGERKQALAEYQTKRANELRTIERQERARAKEVFGQMLAALLPTVSRFSAWDSRFSDIRDMISKDDRFHAVADEGTRESLFLDFCEEFRKRDERKKRNKRRNSQDAFLSFLQEKQDSGHLTYASTWDSFVSSLNEIDRNDSKFAVSQDMSDEDRQLYFADYVIELQKTEDDKRRRIRDARKRAEQEQREAFRASLAKLAISGKLLPASRWRNIEELVSAHPSYRPIYAQDREAPREIFDDFVNEWNINYRRDRTFLSQLVYPSSKSDVIVKENTTFEDFQKALLERASDSPDKHKMTRSILNADNPLSSARLYFNELSMRARGVTGPAFVRRGSALRRKDSESSEDEGEIIEDGELSEIMHR